MPSLIQRQRPYTILWGYKTSKKKDERKCSSCTRSNSSEKSFAHYCMPVAIRMDSGMACLKSNAGTIQGSRTTHRSLGTGSAPGKKKASAPTALTISPCTRLLYAKQAAAHLVGGAGAGLCFDRPPHSLVNLSLLVLGHSIRPQRHGLLLFLLLGRWLAGRQAGRQRAEGNGGGNAHKRARCVAHQSCACRTGGGDTD